MIYNLIILLKRISSLPLCQFSLIADPTLKPYWVNEFPRMSTFYGHKMSNTTPPCVLADDSNCLHSKSAIIINVNGLQAAVNT